MGLGSQTSNSTVSVPPVLQDAALNNLNFAQNLRDQPYQPYTGNRVADFSDYEKQAFGMGQNTALSQPAWANTAGGLYSGYANAPASSINTPSMLGGGYDVAKGGIKDYMSPYTEGALAPTLDEISRRGEIMRNGPGGIGAGATSAGAYGDARHGIELSEQERNQAKLSADTTAQAYDRAYTQAAALRGQDVSNSMATQGQNAALKEQQLSRMLGGGNAMTNLDQYLTGRGMDLSKFLGQIGSLQSQKEQQRLNVPYSDYLAQQQWPFQGLTAYNSALGLGGNLAPKTTETSQPISGWGILGGLTSAALGGKNQPWWMTSDARVKEDIAPVGKLHDGQNVYSFRYKGLPTPMIGLMAQEVEQVRPDAVREFGGVKAVDYEKATRLSRMLGSADFAMAA